MKSEFDKKVKIRRRPASEEERESFFEALADLAVSLYFAELDDAGLKEERKNRPEVKQPDRNTSSREVV